jgi:hypothetical protein
VRVYRSTAPETPTVYGPDDRAEAQPALPGFSVSVRQILPSDWRVSSVQE